MSKDKKITLGVDIVCAVLFAICAALSGFGSTGIIYLIAGTLWMVKALFDYKSEDD